MKRPALSIVIITYNEEKRLPRLLACLKRQTFKDFEVIVADANSTDRTRAIAKAWGTKVVTGGLPSRGRNAGAAVAQADLIQFFDADVEPTKNFLERNVQAFTKRHFAVASTRSIPSSGSAAGYFFYAVWDVLAWCTQRFRQYAAGYSILVRRSAFERINGFNERMRFAEDIDLVRRAARRGRFGILPVPIIVSDRRYAKGGAWRALRTYLLWFFDDLFRPSRRYGNYDYVLGQHAEQRRSKRRL